MRIAYFIGVAILAVVIFWPRPLVVDQPAPQRSAVSQKLSAKSTDEATDVTVVPSNRRLTFVTPLGFCGMLEQIPEKPGLYGFTFDDAFDIYTPYLFTSHSADDTKTFAMHWCEQQYKGRIFDLQQEMKDTEKEILRRGQ